MKTKYYKEVFMGESHIINLQGCGRTSHNIIYVNTVPMLKVLSEETSQALSLPLWCQEYNRQCVETIQEEPKLKWIARFQYG